jgi:hypothetical protein
MLLEFRVQPVDEGPLAGMAGVPIAEESVLEHGAPLRVLRGEQRVPADGQIDRAADAFAVERFDLLA